MEEQSNNAIADASTAQVPNRRTAAIDILSRALHSSPIQDESDDKAKSKALAEAALAARSFLDTTSSVYVLNADTSVNSVIGSNSPTNGIAQNHSPSNALGSSNNSVNVDNIRKENMPNLFGCWNFLHQAMNEIERFEDEKSHMVNQQNQTAISQQPALLAETRLLAEFAVKVSRRSDELDRQKVATCVENFCGSTTSSSIATSRTSASGKENSNNESSSSNDATNDSQENAKARLDEDSNKNGDESTSNSASGNASNHRYDIGVLLPHLVRYNAEIREIVTGRIAAFSFNGGQPTSPLSVASPSSTIPSVFADPLVVETFCQFLAANAVSNGAERLGHFLNDWIIPAATVDPHAMNGNTSNIDGGKRQRLSPDGSPKRLLTHRLPPYSLACVLYHVAAEAGPIPSHESSNDLSSSTSSTARTTSPLGTIDVLQKLSLPVMANVLLGPVLHDSLQRKQLKRQLKQHRQHMQQPLQAEEEGTDMDDKIIAMGLRAILKWCMTTDLSLAQCKHIGSKVHLNLSRLLGEVLETESPEVMSALADLIEYVVEGHIVPDPSQSSQQLISDSRMTQTRYLMQAPDEAFFRASVSQQQLHTIETKELSDILSELSTDIERQRFRFPSFGRTAAKGKDNSTRKTQHGDVIIDDDMHSLGHSLARITAALCMGYSKIVHSDNASATTGEYRIPPGAGMLELLSKCASHPSVLICGIVLPAIAPTLKTQVGLATQWLPTLQRRAIIPHHPNNSAILASSSNSQADNTDIPLLAASDISFVEFEEFMTGFRDTVLAEALNACYSIHSEYYVASCTAAIEEFCVGDVVTEQTSFHLEAALFCLAEVSEQVLSALSLDSSDTSATSPSPSNKTNANISGYLLRCTAALAKKPKSLNNALTMAQACRFMRNYAKWFGSNQHPGTLDIAADLTLHVLVQCATPFTETPLSSTIYKETRITPYGDAAKTLRCLLCNNAEHFLSNKAIAALGAGWEATFAACNLGGKLLSLEDRKETSIGICHVLAALPNDQQQTSLMALALASIACLEAMMERAESLGTTWEEKEISPILDRASDEIIVLVTTARAFTEARLKQNQGDARNRFAFVEPSLAILERAWPTISIAASKYCFHESILESLQFLFIECIFSGYSYRSNKSLAFLQKLCALAMDIIKNETAREKNSRFFLPVLDFVNELVKKHGSKMETILIVKLTDDSFEMISNVTEEDVPMFDCLDSLARETIQAMTGLNLLGRVWTSAQTQGNGQSAMESKSRQRLPQKSADFCSSGLAPFFSFLRTCISCPAFLLRILDFDAIDGYYDDDINNEQGIFVLRKFLESAASSILDVDAEISVSAMAFLESVVTLAERERDHADLVESTDNSAACQGIVREYNLTFQTNMLSILLRGICGMLQPYVMPDACHLLFHVLSESSLSESGLSEEELKVIILKGFSQEHFFLGNRARSIIYEFCLPLLKKTDVAPAPSLESLENLMTDVWRLHRFEDVDMIEKSDAVQSFCARHGRKNNSTTATAP